MADLKHGRAVELVLESLSAFPTWMSAAWNW